MGLAKVERWAKAFPDPFHLPPGQVATTTTPHGQDEDQPEDAARRIPAPHYIRLESRG